MRGSRGAVSAANVLMTMLFVLVQVGAFALEGAEKEYNVKAKSPVAIQGYDTVSYFKENKAVKGDKKITAEHHGITYRFSSEENKAAFEVEPEKYLPTYGGWCATAMAANDKVDINPENFIVEEGRLFLFYKGLFGDAKKDWVKDAAALRPKADSAWGKIVEKAKKQE